MLMNKENRRTGEMPERQRVRRSAQVVGILAAVLAYLNLLAGGAFAETVTGDFGSTDRVNRAAVEKLKKLTPGEIETLDALLSHALTLYYDRKYSLALPIFKEVSDTVATMDVMFWLGTSAANTGDLAMAEAEFKKMLDIDPGLLRVRLELASVYFQQGRYDAARSELDRVSAGDLPEEVRTNVDRLRQVIDARSRKWFGGLRASLGYMWDDNISTGPDPGVYSLPGGSTFSPAPLSAKLSDTAVIGQVIGNIAYDLGAPKGLLWNSGLSLYAKGYREYSMFNYTAVDVNTGPWWTSRRGILKIPVGYTYNEYGSERLSYIVHVDPSVEAFIGTDASLRATYSYREERFYDDTRADNFNSRSHIADLGGSYALLSRRLMIGANFGYSKNTTTSETYTYEAPIAGANVLVRLPTDTELYGAYQWTERDYAGTQGFPYTGMKRRDTRHFYTAALSQPFLKYWFASYVFAYTDNNSNLGLYAWDKTTHTVNVGFQF